MLNESEVTTTGPEDHAHFHLTNDRDWPTGSYRVEVALNDEVRKVIDFAVAPAATAAGPGRRSVEVTALSYGREARGAVGHANRVRITVGDDPARGFRVGFFESEVGGSGEMWRASGWMATVVGMGLAGFNPAHAQVSYDVEGYINGPSAGGLKTVGLLTAIRGDALREDAAVTGTINLDGTIGPVGGIPHKIEGAARAGKKLVLIPSGGRIQPNLNTGQDVDLVTHGRDLGVKVREVYEAYELLTGRTLPRPPVGPHPHAYGTADEQYRRMAYRWIDRYKDTQAEYATLHEAYRVDSVKKLMAEADVAAEQAGRLLQQGMMGAAYDRATTADHKAAVAFRIGETIARWKHDGPEATVAFIEPRIHSLAQVEARIDRLKRARPRTLGAAEMIMEAYTRSIDALVSNVFARDLIEPRPKIDDGTLKSLLMAGNYDQLTTTRLAMAKGCLDLSEHAGGLALPDDAPVEQVADFFVRAAKVNINLFENLVIDEDFARARDTNVEGARRKMLDQDEAYGMAKASLNLLPVLEERLGDGPARAYAKLGGAIAAYNNSSVLVAKYYSLEGRVDKNFQFLGIANDRALLDMLDLAEDQARRSLVLLQRSGADTTHSMVHYEIARLDREQDLDGKLTALTSYWNVYDQSRALAYLGGFAGRIALGGR